MTPMRQHGYFRMHAISVAVVSFTTAETLTTCSENLFGRFLSIAACIRGTTSFCRTPEQVNPFVHAIKTAWVTVFMQTLETVSW